MYHGQSGCGRDAGNQRRLHSHTLIDVHVRPWGLALEAMFWKLKDVSMLIVGVLR